MVLATVTPWAGTLQRAQAERATTTTSVAQARSLSPDEEFQDFDVVIAGGTTAAFAAAVAAAESGARTALIEPTDWVGGQLTASGVPAVDEAWHSVADADTTRPPLNVSKAARLPANITPNFHALLQAIDSPGGCWVSRFCFQPKRFVERQLRPLERRCGDNLIVFLDTVVKRVDRRAGSGQIESITAIQRLPKATVEYNGYDRLPSQDLADWYSPDASPRFDKRILKFRAKQDQERSTVFVEATEWGELLVLAGLPYLQGIENSDGGHNGNDVCGQATVYCFVQEFHTEPVAEPDRKPAATKFGFGDYSDRDDAWERIWTYRRIRGNDKPAPGDLCLQNWGYSPSLEQGGNDYPFGYLFKSKADTELERRDWQGGINLQTLAGAEQRAYGWHEWFKNNAPSTIDPRQISLAIDVLGTGHGLAKLPYIRDTRRAIGLDGYVLKFADLSGPAAQMTGTPFPDRVALGAYPADVHPVSNCKMPQYIRAAHDTLPFFIPFRALTCDGCDNLLTAGKTMAQNFLANSATRLHPIEWSTGTAAGVAAAYMARTGKSSREAYASIDELQRLIKKKTPIDWNIEGKRYPREE